jgi:hypothetical protein
LVGACDSLLFIVIRATPITVAIDGECSNKVDVLAPTSIVDRGSYPSEKEGEEEGSEGHKLEDSGWWAEWIGGPNKS